MRPRRTAGSAELAWLLALVVVASVTGAGTAAAQSDLRALDLGAGGVRLEWEASPGGDEVFRGRCGPMDEILLAPDAPGEWVDAGAVDAAYYRVPGTAPAFRVERRFVTVVGRTSYFFLSWPGLPGIDDVADTSWADPSKCVGASGGPAIGDSVINADDAICSLWSGWRTLTEGTFSLVRIKPSTCTYEARLGQVTPSGVRFLGVPFAIDDPALGRVGYVVGVSGPTAREDAGRIVVSHDASWTGTVVSASPCFRHLLPVPADALYRTADEILCGLEGRDWRDDDGDGDPDACTEGIFDSLSGELVSVTTYDADATTQPETDGLYVTRSVLRVDGTLVFVGRDFALEPAGAVQVALEQAHDPTPYAPPVAGGPLASCP